MSISFSSFASTAFDTARSTFKAMAEAAVPPADGASATSPAAPAESVAPAAAKPAAAPRPRLDITESSEAVPFAGDAPKPVKRRVGTLLDALA
jgi:hypothetical protein